MGASHSQANRDANSPRGVQAQRPSRLGRKPGNQRLRRDRCLVLRRFPYGESSLVVQGISQNSGRVHWLAKGAYRPKSATYGVLDLFDSLDLEWSHQARRELQTLRRAEIATRRRNLSRDLDSYRAGVAVLELCSAAVQPGQPARALFDLTEAALEALQQYAAAPDAIQLWFELRYLEWLGLAPALGNCAVCGGPAGALPHRKAWGRVPRAAFSASCGGRLCAKCAEEARRSGRRVGTLPVGSLEAAKRIAEKGPQHAPAEARQRTLVRDFVARFLEFHLESRPKSYREFLSLPNRNHPGRSSLRTSQ